MHLNASGTVRQSGMAYAGQQARDYMPAHGCVHSGGGYSTWQYIQTIQTTLFPKGKCTLRRRRRREKAEHADKVIATISLQLHSFKTNFNLSLFFVSTHNSKK